METEWKSAGITSTTAPGHEYASPKYLSASWHEALLKKVVLCCVLMLVVLMSIVWRNMLPAWQPLFVTQIAMLLVLLANLQYVWWLTRWRASVLTPLSNPAVNSTFVSHEFLFPRARRLLNFLSARPSIKFAIAIGKFIQGSVRANVATLCMSLCAALALWMVMGYWDWQANPTAFSNSNTTIPLNLFIVLSLVLLAFALLVLERYYAGNRSSELPEALAIVYLLRVSITLMLLLCPGVLLADEMRQWPMQYLVWLGLIPALIAGEFLIRATFSLFTPPPQHEPEFLAESFFAAMWRWPMQPFTHLHDELKQRFGIDLRQSWAFAYIRRALLPVVMSLLGIAWLLSGLTEIALAERGIYERLGAPVAVWQPGLHVGLPWPLGRVQRIENGVVHELAAASVVEDAPLTELPLNSELEPVAVDSASLLAVDGLPPASANRLWDASHVAEKSQIIASEVITAEGKRQSFHVVNMDVRFMYRIGLTDEAAFNARYTSADVPALIRSTANRILVSYFAARTLEGVLGETRTQLALDIGRQLQSDLDALASGVEIMATVLEAIHPPAAAANAYHSVQAAQINAQAIIARERGNAAQQINLAQLRAGMVQHQASASARETLASADVAARRFAAEQEAYQQGGKAFLLEQYYAQLTKGLAAAQLVLVDHRLDAATATIDLRRFSAGGVPSFEGASVGNTSIQNASIENTSVENAMAVNSTPSQ